MADWIGKNNREIHAVPLLDFPRSLQSMGVLRRSKGRRLLTRSGKAARHSPETLWRHLSARLVPSTKDSLVEEASLLLLVYVGTSPDTSVPLGRVTEALEQLAWRRSDGEPLRGYDSTASTCSTYCAMSPSVRSVSVTVTGPAPLPPTAPKTASEWRSTAIRNPPMAAERRHAGRTSPVLPSVRHRPREERRMTR